MLKSFLTRPFRTFLIVIILLLLYNYLDLLPGTIIYAGYGANGRIHTYIIAFNVMNKTNNSKFDADTFVKSSKSSVSSHLQAVVPPDHSNISIYFTVKTTPGSYEKKIRPLQISWFQKVNKEMVSLHGYFIFNIISYT